jgi:hypothetical protein
MKYLIEQVRMLISYGITAALILLWAIPGALLAVKALPS